jgi:hypothetical protein
MNRTEADWFSSRRGRVTVAVACLSIVAAILGGCGAPVHQQLAARPAAASASSVPSRTQPAAPRLTLAPARSQRRSPAPGRRRSVTSHRKRSPAHGRTTSRIPTPSGSGAYVGAGAPGALAAFGRWRGRPADFAVDFLPSLSWTALDSPTWELGRWRAARTPLVIAVPMLTDSSSTTLAAGARGAYDGYFRRLARTLVHYGYGSASLRVGWEMNGTWYRWSAFRDPGAWVTYYRRIVTVMRSVPGQSFRFDWNLNLGSAAVQPARIYPGNAYVSYIGVDAYDWYWRHPASTPAARWAWLVGQPHGLSWVASFAAAHGKPITVPEWGLASTGPVRSGGGDDSYYITAMLSWMRAHHVAYESYFNRKDHTISGEAYPSAAAAYRAAMKS